ncbi:hypothetical protein JCM3774_004765 [Rhodotorula dairenensis]
MTARAARTVLRLDPAGRHWIRVPLSSLNLARHGRSPPRPRPTFFETLASETTPVPSIQAVPQPMTGAGSADGRGTRTGTPKAGAVPVPAAGTPALAQETSFRGIKVPRKPPPPAEGECCMSGCATCVYDLYLDDLEHFHSQVRDAKRRILDSLRAESARPGVQVDLSGWPERELGPPPSESDLRRGGNDGADSGSGSTAGPAATRAADPAEVAEREAAEARNQISDPTLRAFLEMEARMKKKQQKRVEQEATHAPAVVPAAAAEAR